MKYCIHCGKECLDDAIICPACGCSVQYGNVSQNINQPQYQNQNILNSNCESDKFSVLSILGFIFAFLSSIVGLILSIIAYNEAKTIGSAKSSSFAKAGIIISAVGIGLEILVGIIVGILIVVFGAEFLTWFASYLAM